VKLDHITWAAGAEETPSDAEIAGQQHDVFCSHGGIAADGVCGTIADWVIRPRLLKSPASRSFHPRRRCKQYQVLIDPTALLEYGVTLQRGRTSLKESNINTSGGFAVPRRDRTVRSVCWAGWAGFASGCGETCERSDPSSPRPIGVVEPSGPVVEGPQFKRGDGSVNGRAGVVFTIVQQPHVDTRSADRPDGSSLERNRSALASRLRHQLRFVPLKNFIDRGIFNVARDSSSGAVLVLDYPISVLLNFPHEFITLTAIRCRWSSRRSVFRLMGHLNGNASLNQRHDAGGIAVAMGELVDDAIVRC